MSPTHHRNPLALLTPTMHKVLERMHRAQKVPMHALTPQLARAAYAAKRYFNFKTVIPCHYRTFPLLAQNADVLKAGLPGVNVIEPQVLEPITL